MSSEINCLSCDCCLDVNCVANPPFFEPSVAQLNGRYTYKYKVNISAKTLMIIRYMRNFPFRFPKLEFCMVSSSISVGYRRLFAKIVFIIHNPFVLAGGLTGSIWN